jgi:hypothetical protein
MQQLINRLLTACSHCRYCGQPVDERTLSFESALSPYFLHRGKGRLIYYEALRKAGGLVTSCARCAWLKSQPELVGLSVLHWMREGRYEVTWLSTPAPSPMMPGYIARPPLRSSPRMTLDERCLRLMRGRMLRVIGSPDPRFKNLRKTGGEFYLTASATTRELAFSFEPQSHVTHILARLRHLGEKKSRDIRTANRPT